MTKVTKDIIEDYHNVFIMNVGDKLLGERIKQIRYRSGYRIKEFADSLEICLHELKLIESGRQLPDQATLIMLHDIHGIKLHKLAVQ